jgi:hypothetical protein
MMGPEYDGKLSEAAGVPPTGDRRQPEGRSSKSDRARNRSDAKIGMSLAMGALVVTGMMPGRGSGKLHIISGIALVGFSFWHHHLYQDSPRGRRA